MSLTARPEGQAPAPESYAPWCTACGTDEYLIIESVEPFAGAGAAGGTPEFLEISYTCSECDRFYGHPVRHSPLWARRLTSDPGAAEYLHCGEPMQPRDSSAVSILEPLHTDPFNEIVADVVLETTVLRCSCGFQISLPA